MYVFSYVINFIQCTIFTRAETTAMNPQFFVQIPRTTSSKCHVVVSVTQHYETRDGLHLLSKQKKIGGCAGGSGSGGGSSAINRAMHAIGFAVYEVPPNVNRLTSHFVAEHVSGISKIKKKK